jgi:catechol 2,3-dioxygenase-like lactoylglutathione lyase family enzyme
LSCDPFVGLEAPVLRAYSHFSFVVGDIERAVVWYRDVLGLQVVARQRQDNDYTRRFVGVPGAILEVAEFALPGATAPEDVLLELIEYVEPRAECPPPRRQDVGSAHLSFIVDDIFTEHERLSEAGAIFVTPPVRIEDGVNVGGWVCYLSDPDGITLELFQPAGRAD